MIDIYEHKQAVLIGIAAVTLAGAYSVLVQTGSVVGALGVAVSLGIIGPLFFFYGADTETAESAS